MEKPDCYRPSLPHVKTIKGFQVLLSSITCLPSYYIGKRYLPYSSPPPHPVYVPHPISKWSTRPLPHSLYPGHTSVLRTPVECQFSLELDTVLTASPTLINFTSLLFWLFSGNSFPTCARTMTYSTFCYSYYLVIIYNWKEYEKGCVCVCIYIYIYTTLLHLKLTQQCKSTILQLRNGKWKN